MTDQGLTYKLCMLLSLNRVSGLQYLDIRYMTRGDNKVKFYFAKLYKSWREGKPLPSLVSLKIPNYRSLKLSIRILIGQKTEGLETPSCCLVFKNHIRKLLVALSQVELKRF